MSEQTPDVSKVVRLIMENPSIIEEISSLIKSDGKESEQAPPAPEAAPTSVTEVQSVQAAPPPIAEPSTSHHARNRTELLCAMKPYVSAERAKAIDSMISITGILEMMRGE